MQITARDATEADLANLRSARYTERSTSLEDGIAASVAAWTD